MEGDTVLLQDIFHRVDTAEGMGRLVPTGLRPKILDELALSGVEVPPHIFRNEDVRRDCSHLEVRRAPPPARPGPGRVASHPPKRCTRCSRGAATGGEADHARQHCNLVRRPRPSWRPSSWAPVWPSPSSR